MGSIKKYIFGNKRQKRKAVYNAKSSIVGKNTMLLIGVGGLLYVLAKNADYSGPPRKVVNPAFTYPPNQTMDDQTEDALVNALFAHRGVNKENATMNDGSKLTEAVYQQLLADFNAAIAYYPDRPQKNLEKLRDDLVNFKDQLVAPLEGVGMGPISGFSGVY
tara:strand:+ start:85 stop:570 length:486 start_codon:yes stop_codon:yes gene_type:complete